MSVRRPRYNIPFLVLAYSAILFKNAAWAMSRLFAECHDDFALNPKDGPLDDYAFPWVAIVQYVHVTTGVIHTGRAPRAVLLHRQFVVATAKDLKQLPKNYKLCGSSYIGQTMRTIAERVKEHIAAVKKRQVNKSAVAEHLESGKNHWIEQHDPKILSTERHYYSRILREAIEIKKHPHNFNREDGFKLSASWNPVVRLCKNCHSLIQREDTVSVVCSRTYIPNNDLTTADEYYPNETSGKRGNVIFGQYERDEQECGLTQLQMRMGVTCPRAFIEMPIDEITIHPEFLRFGVSNSLGLVRLIRPMRSRYMLPICLPSLGERFRRRDNKVVFMVDYINGVPINFGSESLAKKTLKLYTDKECRRHRKRFKLEAEGVTQLLCTSGCGVRSGSPIATQNTGGAFELVGVAVGGSPCSSPAMRRRLNEAPPIFIDVYPYANWIVSVIGATVFPQPYPTHLFRRAPGHSDVAIVPSEDMVPLALTGSSNFIAFWRGRQFVYGVPECKETLTRKSKMSVFYSDNFVLHGDGVTKLQVFLKVIASTDTMIQCVKVFTPTTVVKPSIQVDNFNMSLSLMTDWFPYSFMFTLALVGRTATAAEQAKNTDIRGPTRGVPGRLNKEKLKPLLKQNKKKLIKVKTSGRR